MKRTNKVNDGRLATWFVARSDELVASVFACIVCGERRMDWLTPEPDGDHIYCHKCHCIYPI